MVKMVKVIVAFVCFAALAAGCAVTAPGSEGAQDEQATRDQLREAVSQLQAFDVADLSSTPDVETMRQDGEPDPNLTCSLKDGCLTCCAGSRCCTNCSDGSGSCNF